MMRKTILLVFLWAAVALHAAPWSSEMFRCSADLPSTPGWQPVDVPSTAGVTNLVVMQNTLKSAAFGIAVIEGLNSANLADPAVRQALETRLRQLGYRFAGYSKVNFGGLDWLQYSVSSGAGPQRVSGVIRYASADDHIFSISMLRGGGQEGATDPELQTAAASFRVGVFAAAAAADPSQAGGGGQNAVTTSSAPASDNPLAAYWNPRIAWYAGIGLVILLIFIRIVGGGANDRR